MSTIGKSSKSIRKADLASQKTTALGFKKLVFAHKATAGDTGINLLGMSVPTELSSVGFVQPSVTDLMASNLKANRQNVQVVSSARGVLQDWLSYDFSDSSRISFQGFTALANEIFTITIDPAPKTGMLVVDATPIVATGTLAATQTSFNVGVPFSVNKYPTQQLGAVLVFLDGVQQFRNTGNSSSNLDGNYYEYDAGNGLANQIIFNQADLTNDRSVLVVSNGLLAERPSGSMMAYLENVQGQVNKLIDVTSALSGLDENDFRVAPSSVDLKTFGDRVSALEDVALPAASPTENGGHVTNGIQTFGGIKSFSNNTYVRAQRSGNQTLSDSGSTTLIFNNEQFDRNNEYNSSTGVFTAQVEGIYLVTLGIVMSNSSAVTRVQVNVTANVTHQLLDLAGGTIRAVGGSVAVFLGAGQTMTCSTFTTGTSVVMDTATSHITITKIA